MSDYDDYPEEDSGTQRYDYPEADSSTQRCTECRREWHGPEANECPDCYSAGGRPVPCFSCQSPMSWVPGREAECSGCDARYSLETIRTYRLGQLVERLAVESSKNGTAEEVGKMILAHGRAALRRLA